jgi:hypothetical protein
MNRRIIDTWIANKVKVAVIMNTKCFDNTNYIHTAGTIKECDDVGILFESSMKDTFYIPYTSIIELEVKK